MSKEEMVLLTFKPGDQQKNNGDKWMSKEKMGSWNSWSEGGLRQFTIICLCDAWCVSVKKNHI